MGYLSNSTVTVEAILTKKGRQLLSKGREYFNITKFALSDDEVDYRLWNPSHASGSNYYGYAIEQLPVLEPTPDETQTMRYKLVCLDKSTVKIPIVSVFPTSVYISEGEEVIITPNTIQGGGSSGAAQTANLNANLGYTAVLHNSDAAFLQVIDAAPGAGAGINNVENMIATIQRQLLVANLTPELRAQLTSMLQSLVANQQALASGMGLQGVGNPVPVLIGDTDSPKSVFAVGLKFKLIAKGLAFHQTIYTTLTIVGNETGGSAAVTIRNMDRG